MNNRHYYVIFSAVSKDFKAYDDNMTIVLLLNSVIISIKYYWRPI